MAFGHVYVEGWDPTWLWLVLGIPVLVIVLAWIIDWLADWWGTLGIVATVFGVIWLIGGTWVVSSFHDESAKIEALRGLDFSHIELTGDGDQFTAIYNEKLAFGHMVFIEGEYWGVFTYDPPSDLKRYME